MSFFSSALRLLQLSSSPQRADDTSAAAAAAAPPGAPPSDADSRAAAATADVTEPVVYAVMRGSVRPAGLSWASLESDVLPSRLSRCTRLLDGPHRVIDVDALREAAWSGLPARYRMATWQMLFGYLPLQRDRVPEALARRKAEYLAAVSHSRALGGAGGRSESEQALLRQVLVDVPRTCPDVPLFHCEWVQRSLERVLFTYAARHFATGYVQGLNDLATPLYAVFLSAWLDPWTAHSVDGIDDATLGDIEADIYWCLCRLLEGIQDHYTPSQPGIQRMIHRLRELVHRIDGARAGRAHQLTHEHTTSFVFKSSPPPPHTQPPPSCPPQSRSSITSRVSASIFRRLRFGG